jgi:hypothetical protein
MEDDELAPFQRLRGRTAPPAERVEETRASLRQKPNGAVAAATERERGLWEIPPGHFRSCARRGAIMDRQEMDAQDGEDGKSRYSESDETGDGMVSGTAESRSPQSVSAKKINANRRNSQRSTGPKTDLGKQASRMNALKHALLAKEIVITRGDNKEDEWAFAQLLEDLHADRQPIGVVEELEVQKIALCYWRKKRAIRYEHGAIRQQRTGDLREHEQRRREKALHAYGSFASDCAASSQGIQSLIDRWAQVKQEILDGPLSLESLDLVGEMFPDYVVEPDETGVEDEGVEDEGVDEGVVAPPEYYLRELELRSGIDAELRRLSRLRQKAVRTERLALEAKIRTAALPRLEVVDNLVRYETSNDRELDRALNRLERMQERRRAKGGTPPEA